MEQKAASPPSVLVVDYDETLGSFLQITRVLETLAHLLSTDAKLKRKSPSYKLQLLQGAAQQVAPPAFRPKILELMKMISRLKKAGILNLVVLYTAAMPPTAPVWDELKTSSQEVVLRVLEDEAQTGRVFDIVLFSKGQRKDLGRWPDSKVFVLDDRSLAENYINAAADRVGSFLLSPFFQKPRATADLLKEFDKVLKNSEVTYPFMRHATESLKKILDKEAARASVPTSPVDIPDALQQLLKFENTAECKTMRDCKKGQECHLETQLCVPLDEDSMTRAEILEGVNTLFDNSNFYQINGVPAKLVSVEVMDELTEDQIDPVLDSTDGPLQVVVKFKAESMFQDLPDNGMLYVIKSVLSPVFPVALHWDKHADRTASITWHLPAKTRNK